MVGAKKHRNFLQFPERGVLLFKLVNSGMPFRKINNHFGYNRTQIKRLVSKMSAVFREYHLIALGIKREYENRKGKDPYIIIEFDEHLIACCPL